MWIVVVVCARLLSVTVPFFSELSVIVCLRIMYSITLCIPLRIRWKSAKFVFFGWFLLVVCLRLLFFVLFCWTLICCIVDSRISRTPNYSYRCMFFLHYVVTFIDYSNNESVAYILGALHCIVFQLLLMWLGHLLPLTDKQNTRKTL